MFIGGIMNYSPLQKARYEYQPKLPLILQNDINDIEAMELVQYKLAPKNLNPILPFKVKDLQVTENYGGSGAIREIADILVSLK